MKKILKNILYLLRINKRTYYYEVFIYVFPNGELCKDGITSIVKFLDRFQIKSYTERKADIEAFKISNEKFPQYKGSLWLF